MILRVEYRLYIVAMILAKEIDWKSCGLRALSSLTNSHEAHFRMAIEI